MSASDHDDEFVAFVGGRGTALLRTAYLVTTDADRAEEAVVEALARTRVDWAQAEGGGAAESYARRQLLAEHPRLRLPAFLDPAGADAEPAQPHRAAGHHDPHGSEAAGEEEPDEQDRALLWAAFGELTQGQRAVLVLGVHESLDDEEIAHVVGRPVRAVRAEIARALGWLRTLTEPPGRHGGRPLTDRLSEVLDLRARDVRAHPDLAERALARSRTVRGRRRRTTAVVSGGLVLVVGVLAVTAALGAGSDGAPTPGISPAPSGSGGGSSPTPGDAVVAVPDAVLRLARDEGALLGYGSTVVDGATRPVSALVIDPDPATGASRGNVIVGLARAEGGYVVLSRPPESATLPSTWTLAYLPRVGSPVELALVDYQAPGFAVSPDGLSVVHVAYGGVDPSGQLRSSESRLVVQTLGGQVVDQVILTGRAAPLSVDGDKVWYRRADDPPGPPYVWDRQTGATSRLAVGTSQTATSVRADFVATIAGPRGSRCTSLYDGHAVRAPQRLWTRCGAWSGALLDPMGRRAAVLLDGHPALAVLGAGTGDTFGMADLPALGGVAMAWTADGQRLLVEQGVDGQVSVMAVIPSLTKVPPGVPIVIGEPIVHRLGDDQVVLGRELPIP